MGMPTNFEVPVVGVTFQEGYPVTLAGITPHTKAVLVREPQNVSDPNAVHVELENGKIVGFIPAAVAKRLSVEMDNGVEFEVTIRATVTPGHENRPGAVLSVSKLPAVSRQS